MAEPLQTLRANRPLLLLWAGQVISQSGDAVFELALLWLALDLTGSSAAAGWIAGATYLPALVFGLFGGALADRFDHRRLMLLSDAVRAGIAVAIPLLALSGHLSTWALGGLAFALACFTSFFNPARDALLPRLVSPEQLVPANSLLQTCWQLSLVVGPLIAAGLLPLVGVVHLFSVDALSFLASFGLLFAMRTPRAAASSELGTKAALGHAWRDVLEGLRYAKADPRIAGLLGVTALDNLLLMGPAIVGVPLFVREVLHAGAVVYAGSAVPYAAGMFVGTLLLNAWGKRFAPGAVLLAGMLLDGLTLLPFFWIHTATQLWVTLLIHGLATPLIVISRPTLVQTVVPPRMQGRVFGMISTAVVGFSALSSALTGVLAAHLDLRVLFAGIALAAGACGGLGMLFTPLRRAGSAESHDPAPRWSP